MGVDRGRTDAGPRPRRHGHMPAALSRLAASPRGPCRFALADHDDIALEIDLLDRSGSPSRKRMPVPYNSRASNPVAPSIRTRVCWISVAVSTTGMRFVGSGRPIFCIHGSSRSSTSLYKNSNALKLGLIHSSRLTKRIDKAFDQRTRDVHHLGALGRQRRICVTP